jgi:hypothetical protein
VGPSGSEWVMYARARVPSAVGACLLATSFLSGTGRDASPTAKGERAFPARSRRPWTSVSYASQ